MANGISTEWEDIHVKLGNYVARDKVTSNDDIEKLAIEAIENYDPLENKTIEELKELEDDEDEEILRIYEERRLAELKEMAKKPKFGKVFELRKHDYVAEVTNAPKDVYVVLHLYQNYNESSNILANIFDKLASKHIFVKFMRIVATNCIENYKDDDVPGVIVYHNGKLLRQFIPATYYFGGKVPSWKSNYL
jgi:vacuolar-type H+-ATPase subunit I/STV1